MWMVVAVLVWMVDVVVVIAIVRRMVVIEWTVVATVVGITDIVARTRWHIDIVVERVAMA
jgi:hypothetical protein